MASIHVSPDTAKNRPVYVEPEATYYGNHPKTDQVKLRIATGGAGQSGLIKALADAFIEYCVKKGQEPFAVAWLKSDTSASFNYLAQNSSDVAITYHEKAEDTALAQGIADKRIYAWRDHFLFVGPKTDPGKLKSTVTDETTIYDLFVDLFRAAVRTANDANRVNFMSRYDKSATNIKESEIWAHVGQAPWTYPYSFWYHRYNVFPFQALDAAAKLEEYTITDRGTFLGVKKDVRDQLIVIMEGKDDDKDPVLLNPARLLVGTYAVNKKTAEAFADWMVASDGGQDIVGNFPDDQHHNLYTRAPRLQS